MKKLHIIFLLLICPIFIGATESAKMLDVKLYDSEKEHSQIKTELRKLELKNMATEKKLNALCKEKKMLHLMIDSLQNKYYTVATGQTELAKRIEKNNKLVLATKNVLSSRTIWGICSLAALFMAIIATVFALIKKIKSGNTSIDEVRKAQDALQTAQAKMQEESIRLDDKLLELFDRQITNAPKIVDKDKPDHSLALKVADEIVRIELNMARMDSSVKGYKQLAKAVERIKDNFKANGYEIVDMLGKPYNEGMKVTANFVADEDLEEGKQIITGIIKPQINYNGQMIQAAEITVSQNI